MESKDMNYQQDKLRFEEKKIKDQNPNWTLIETKSF